MRIEILVFEVAGERFGIPTRVVVEVFRAATVSPLPNAPETIEGILNVHGRIVPVVDTRHALNLPQREMRHTDHLIQVRVDGREIILWVDRAIDLVLLESNGPDTPESPQGVTDSDSGMLLSLVGKTSAGLVRVLDAARLLGTREAEVLADALSGKTAIEVTM